MALRDWSFFARNRKSSLLTMIASFAITSRLILSGFALEVLAAAIPAQATPFVSPSDRVYADIEHLAAAGLIDTFVVGARPYSRREIVRLLGEAKRNVGRNPGARAWAEETIAADLERYVEKEFRPIDAARVELAYLDSPYRFVPRDPNGSIDATINPLATYRGGRPIADGSTGALETLHSATLGSHAISAISCA